MLLNRPLTDQSSRYTILKNKNLSIPPGAAPCCPQAADSKNPIPNSEQLPLGSDFAEFLDRDNQTDVNFPDLGDFGDLPPIPLETYHSDMDPFNLSTSETDQFPLHSSLAPFAGTSLDSTSHALDGDSPRPSSSRDFCNWKADVSGLETDAGAAGLTEELQRLIASHGLTSEEVESQLASFLQPGRDPMQIDYQPDTEPADSSTPGDSSSRSAKSRRTTITMDNIASETLVEVMQVLINAKAKVRFETE